MNPGSYEKNIERIFDSYCKRIIKRKFLDYLREIKRRSKHEIVFSDMPAQTLENLSKTDKYFADEYIFNVLGKNISVSESDLANALNLLTTEKREIVLLSYFFGMSDREISEALKMARRTVNYQRLKSLQELRKILESEV